MIFVKVLVTSFTPFYKSINNYSTEVIKYIKNVEKITIDVVYDKCYLDVSSAYDLDSFDLIIAMGEARMRNELTLETQAKNISSCSIADDWQIDRTVVPGFSYSAGIHHSHLWLLIPLPAKLGYE